MLIEVTLRVVKNEIRATLRKAIFEHPLSEEPARRAITPILNRLMAASEDSAAYWAELKDRVRRFTHIPAAIHLFVNFIFSFISSCCFIWKDRIPKKSILTGSSDVPLRAE